MIVMSYSIICKKSFTNPTLRCFVKIISVFISENHLFGFEIFMNSSQIILMHFKKCVCSILSSLKNDILLIYFLYMPLILICKTSFIAWFTRFHTLCDSLEISVYHRNFHCSIVIFNLTLLPFLAFQSLLPHL